MSEWKTYKLGELGSFFGGVTSIKREDYGHGTPFLPYKNVYKNSKVDLSSLELMNVNANDIEKRSCKYGDIFFTASSETPDEVAMSSVLLDEVPKLTFNGFCKRYRLYDYTVLLPEYARYLFRGPLFRVYVYELATGDVRFNISQESLAKIEINLPPITTQTAIAEILSSLDDKIELNNAINKNLEELAQALFKRWFVDFEFPDENGQPYKSSGGEMVESELGMIPKEWRVGKLSEFLTVKYGKNHKHLDSGSIPVYGSGGIMRHVSKPLYNKKSILIPRKGTLSNLFLLKEPFWSVDTMFYTIIHNEAHAEYLFYYLKSMDLASMNVGSAVPSMTTKVLNDLSILKPSENLIIQFNRVCDAFFGYKINVVYESKRLEKLRDTLLPELLSGNLKV